MHTPVNPVSLKITYPVHCPICNAISTKCTPAILGEFPKVAMNISDDTQAFSYLCDDCDHVYQVPSIPQTLWDAYYKDYFSPQWLERRIHSEPWFAPIVARLEEPNGETVKERLNFYDSMIDFRYEMSGKTILDYGGQESFYTKRVFPTSKIINFDISGGRSQQDIEEILPTVDLFFSTHVFEHISRPRESLLSMSDKLSVGSKLFIEVPKDYSGSIVDTFFACDQHQKINGKPLWHPLSVLHEHVHHYSKKSLIRLVTVAGFEVEQFIVSSFCLAILAKKPTRLRGILNKLSPL